MESTDYSEAAVSPLQWVPVNIGGSKLLAKAWFGDTEYRVLLSDLNNVWEEEMSMEHIQSRLQDLNKRLRAPVQAFFSHLRSLALPCFSGYSDDQGKAANFTLEYQGNNLTVKLKSELGGVPFCWEFHCTPASVVVVSKELLCPLMAMTQVLQRQVGDLAALLVSKDAEIQDYKENGAQLSRGRLQTEPFDDETFRENFTKRLLKMDGFQNNLEFDSELQKLYVAVTTVKTTPKRKHSDEYNSDTANSISFVPEQIAPEQDQASNVSQGMRPASSGCRQKEETTDAINKKVAFKPDASAVEAVPPDRSSARPKKKKAAGLFR